MPSMLALMVGIALAASPMQLVLAADSPSAAVDTVRTKDGKLHAGKILSETARGYLFHNEQTADTYVIEFGKIVDLARAQSTPAPSPPSPPASEVPPPPPPSTPPNLSPPPPPSVFVPRPSALEEANRIGRIAELQREVVHLREELDDATLAGPIVKLVGATALTGLALGLFVARDGNPNGTAAQLWGAIGSGVLAAGLFIWGGIQLRLRVNALRELPEEIRVREEQLRVLRRAEVAPQPPVPKSEKERCWDRCVAKAKKCLPPAPTGDDGAKERCDTEQADCIAACHDVHGQ